MGVDLDAGALELGEPEVTQGCFLWGYDVLAVFEVAASAGDYCWAVCQVMDGVDVAAQGQGGVVPEAGAVGFFGGLQSVDEVGEEFGLFFVAVLGDDFAGSVGVVAHVVGGDGGAHAADEGVERLAVGEDA